MASFYNPYHRYYRPYFPTNFRNTPIIQKSPSVEDKSQSDSSFGEETSTKTVKKEKKSSRYNSFGPIHFKNPIFHNDIEEPIFEILGIKLYLDDIIILGLLFFLYQEGVQDEMLYIALILLLLS